MPVLPLDAESAASQREVQGGAPLSLEQCEDLWWLSGVEDVPRLPLRPPRETLKTPRTPRRTPRGKRRGSRFVNWLSTSGQDGAVTNRPGGSPDLFSRLMNRISG